MIKTAKEKAEQALEAQRQTHKVLLREYPWAERVFRVEEGYLADALANQVAIWEIALSSSGGYSHLAQTPQKAPPDVEVEQAVEAERLKMRVQVAARIAASLFSKYSIMEQLGNEEEGGLYEADASQIDVIARILRVLNELVD